MAGEEKAETEMKDWEEPAQSNMDTTTPTLNQSQSEPLSNASNGSLAVPPQIQTQDQPTAPASQSSHAPSQPSPLSSIPPITPSTPVAAQSSIHSPSTTPARGTGTGRGRGRGRGGFRGRPGRRKSSGTPLRQDDTDEESDSEEFTMEGVKTKSGRKVHRPTHFDPAEKTPTRRRGPYRRFHDSRICKICQRGHSPQSNMIVFCDGCNTPYHQLCHDPPIDDLVIAVADAEWYCRECSKKRQDRPLRTGLSGLGLTEDEKRTYLASLPATSLVELLFFAEKTHPDLKIYDPDTKKIVERIKATGQAHEPKPQSTPAVAVNGDIASLVGTGTRESINYEELIIRALWAINDPVGVQPRFIWEWLKNNHPNLAAREVRLEAQNPLQKLLRNNRVIREGHQYRVNPAHPQNPKPFNLSLSSVTISNPQPKANNARNATAYYNDASSQESIIQMGMLPPGAGIKLPPETEDEDMLVEKPDDRSFSHKWTVGVVSVVRAGNPPAALVPAPAQSTVGVDVDMADGDPDPDADAEGVDDMM